MKSVNWGLDFVKTQNVLDTGTLGGVYNLKTGEISFWSKISDDKIFHLIVPILIHETLHKVVSRVEGIRATRYLDSPKMELFGIENYHRTFWIITWLKLKYNLRWRLRNLKRA